MKNEPVIIPKNFPPQNNYLVRLVIEDRVKAYTEEEAIKKISNQTWNDKLGNLPGGRMEVDLIDD